MMMMMMMIYKYTLQKATLLTISATLRYIKWKITNFSSSTPVRRLLCSKPRENSYKPLLLRNYSLLAIFSNLAVKAHVHSVMHGQLWKPQHTYVKRAAPL